VKGILTLSSCNETIHSLAGFKLKNKIKYISKLKLSELVGSVSQILHFFSETLKISDRQSLSILQILKKRFLDGM